MTVLLDAMGGVARRRPCLATTPAGRRASRGCGLGPARTRSMRSWRSCATRATTVTACGSGRCSSCCGRAGLRSGKRSCSPNRTSTGGPDRSSSGRARAAAAAGSAWMSSSRRRESCGRGLPADPNGGARSRPSGRPECVGGWWDGRRAGKSRSRRRSAHRRSSAWPRMSSDEQQQLDPGRARLAK